MNNKDELKYTLLPELLRKRIQKIGIHHYLRVKFVNDYLHYLKNRKQNEEN